MEKHPQNGRGIISADSIIHSNRIMREYNEQLWVHKSDELEQLLKKTQTTKTPKGETVNLTGPSSTKETESIINNLSRIKHQMVMLGRSTKHLRKK